MLEKKPDGVSISDAVIQLSTTGKYPFEGDFISWIKKKEINK